MKIRRLIVVGFSGLFLFVVLIFGVPNILNPVEADALAELPLAQNVAEAAPLAIPLVMTAPTSVSLVPEKLGVVGLDYTFVATVVPTDTTQPISYTWEATGQSSVGHVSGLTDTVSYTWPVSGTQVVTVTATNSWGVVTDTYTIFVSDLLNLDTMVVFDVSGSMDYETNCFGCWQKGLPGDPGPDIMTYPYPANGTFYPLNYTPNTGGGPYSIFWDSNSAATPNNAACSATPASKQIVETVTGTPYHYLVHEAEFYARTYPHNGWEFDQRIPGQGFWVLQRPSPIENASNNAYISAHPFVTYSQNFVAYIPRIQGAAYNADCFAENPDNPGEYGPFGDCWSSKGLPETANNNPPYVEYDFTPDWTGDLHIWVRALGGWTWSFEWDGNNPTAPSVVALTSYRTGVFWQVDNGPVGGGEYEMLGRKATRYEVNMTLASGGRDKWRWVKIADEQNTPAVVAGEHHTLRIYQGSSGFNIDKIIITDNPEGDIFNTIIDDGRTALVVTDDTDVYNAGTATVLGTNSNKLDIAKDVLSLNTGQGPDVSDGSATREACNHCNPAYGETVDLAQCTCRKTGETSGAGTGDVAGCTFVTEQTNQFTNDLFYDRAPLRNAKEGAKNFAAQLDPKFDQLGVVAFNNNTPDRVKLQCLVFGGLDLCAGGSTPITYAYVIKDLENYTNYDATNIAQGLREGLEELGVSVQGYNDGVGHDCPTAPSPLPSDPPSSLDDDNKQACDRQGAAQRVLILLTDGVPNRWPGYPSDPGNCPGNADALWRGQVGGGNQGFDCAIFYAEAAANNKVALYTIGLGPGTSHEFLTAMAEGTDPNPLPGDDGFYFEPYCGKYFSAANLNDLDAIFEQILMLARSCTQPGSNPVPPASPQISSLTGYSLLQNDLLTVRLSNHPTNDSYYIYLSNANYTYQICPGNSPGAVTVSNPTEEIVCDLGAAVGGPLPIVPGMYQLYSSKIGSAPAIFVVDVNEIAIIPSAAPEIVVAGGNTWANNDQTWLALNFHPIADLYDIKLFDPSGTLIDVITETLDISSTNITPWHVHDADPPLCSAGGCTIRSYIAGTSTEVARTTVKINQPYITLSKGTGPYARGETVYVWLFSHTPNRQYTILVDGADQASLATIATNADGDTTIPVLWVIPSECGGVAGSWPDATDYMVTSHPAGTTTPASTIAQFSNVEIKTPSNPFITVVGGDTWPAGSFINIQVLKHNSNTSHYLEFDSVRIPTAAADDTFMTDGCGEAIIGYTIPLTQAEGTYPVTSFDDATNTEQATVDVIVLTKPTISVVEGSVVMPDQTITIEGTDHLPNTSYAIYYANKFLQGVLAQSDGTFSFTYDLTTLPTSPPPDLTDVNNLGIPYILKSQTVVAPITDVATTTLTLEAPVLLPPDLYLPIILKE